MVRVMFLRSCLLALLALAPVFAAAEPAWLSRAWQTEDGLLNNDVTSINQAPDGAMLIATQRGLSRFDSFRWREVPTDVPGHSGQSVTGVFSAHDATLWLVTRSVVVARRPGQPQRVLEMPHVDVGGGPVTAFFEQPKGVVWLAFDSGRLHRIEGDRIEQAPVAPGLPSTFATAATVDAEGGIWAAGSGVLAHWGHGRFESVAKLPAGKTVICPASAGGLWIGTGRKLLRYTPSDGVAEAGELSAGVPGVRVTALLEDRAGHLWVGTTLGGLQQWSGSSFRPMPVSKDVWWLSEDHEGNIWAATNGAGACRLRPRVLTPLDEPGAPAQQTARDLCRDAHGNIWVATSSGRLFVRRDGGWRELLPDKDWPAASAASVAAAPNGDVWIATGRGDLVRWDGTAFTRESLPPDPKKAAIITMLVSREGELWIARGYSVFRGRPGKWREFGVAYGAVASLAQDSAGRVWAGTFTGALLRADGAGLVREVETELNTHGGGLRALLATADGALWIATEGGGIARLANGHCSAVTTAQGLPHDAVSQLALDSRNRLWAATDLGIFMVPLDGLTSVMEGYSPAVHATSFSQSEGIRGLQAAGGSSLVAPDGRLWFSTRSGIVIADPGMVGRNQTPPPVAIETMRVNGMPVTDAARIGPGVKQVQFELSAFSFTAPEHVRLFHRLEGLDSEWMATTTDRVASYTHLAPGDYTLRVRAENNDGLISRRDATLAFTVRPFVWETTWFRTALGGLALLAAIGTMYVAGERRLRRQAEAHRREQEIERERTRIARDIHDQLGANLTQISLISDLAQATGEPSAHLPKLANTARQAIASLDEIVWAVNPRHDNFASLLEYLAQQATELLQPAGIRCRLEFPRSPASRHLPADFRHHLFLIVREALNNAVKYSSATEIRIQVESNDSLQVTISDDGHGFSESAVQGEHNGLANMRERARDLGGDCHITSAPSSGTVVQIHVPWP